MNNMNGENVEDWAERNSINLIHGVNFRYHLKMVDGGKYTISQYFFES